MVVELVGVRVEIVSLCEPADEFSYVCWIDALFFFQAEDGIRYLVRSRGLGDVYKRQSQWWTAFGDGRLQELVERTLANNTELLAAAARVAVSYTHLTLPTSDLV